jgi:transcriptional regulator with XRE-family HTH domain
MSRLGEQLKELRQGRSLVSVEKGTGISRIEISRYEQGRYAPSPPNLKKLAVFYEVSYSTLRLLYYEDLLTEPEERAIVLEWARNQQ